MAGDTSGFRREFMAWLGERSDTGPGLLLHYTMEQSEWRPVGFIGEQADRMYFDLSAIEIDAQHNVVAILGVHDEPGNADLVEHWQSLDYATMNGFDVFQISDEPAPFGFTCPVYQCNRTMPCPLHPF